MLNKLLYKLQMIPHSLTYDTYRHRYTIHPSFRFNGPGVRLAGTGKIILGENSYIGRYSSIGSHHPAKVVIGKGCRIAHMVQLFTHGLDTDQDLSKPEPQYTYGSIEIGDYCWIGSQTIILPSVTIGENTVIGANSTVTHDIPAYTVAAGTPAKVIKNHDKNTGEHI